MWKRVALLLAISALAACAQPPAPAPAAAAPRASTNDQPAVALAPQAARTVASANGLQGQWDTTLPSDPSYTGVALIDAEHRVTFDAMGKHGRGQSFGYARAEFPKVEIFLTDRAAVTRFICTMTSPDRMECRGVLPDGRFTPPAVMTRVGPGPATLLR